MKNDLYAIAVTAICLIVMTKMFEFPLRAIAQPSMATQQSETPTTNVIGPTNFHKSAYVF